MPDPSTLGAMALFALTTAITPGPVNVICAISGGQFGFWRSSGFVTGATLCFVALLLALGSGVVAGTGWVESASTPMTWLGAGYLLWLAWRISGAGTLDASGDDRKNPSFREGALAQGINPKAWFVSLAATTTFVLPLPDRTTGLIVFALLYLVICWLSLAVWVWLGSKLAASWGRGFNRAMALLLVLSVGWMLVGLTGG
ncbi:MAG: lysine transporter LysE [Gammaproteobacteria bacterium]|nr:MAG: lysine transporter LysE [Gammaproteobacteria bacterium]